MAKTMTLISSLLVFALAVCPYINIFWGEFTFDDLFAVVQNGDIKTTSPISNILIHDFWGQNLYSTSSHKSFRPLTTLSFRLNYAFDELDPFYYHVANVILHGIVSVLVLFLAKVVFNGLRTKEEKIGKMNEMLQQDLAPVCAAVLFAAHPVHAEAVSSVVGRAEVLCCFFYLLSFFCYQFMVSPKANIFKQGFFFILLTFFFFCACFSKELGITLLGILAACEVFNIIQRGIDLKKKSLHKEGIYSLIRIGLFIALGVGYILMRKWFIGEAVSVGHEVFRRLENPIAFMPFGMSKILTIAWANIYYFYLLLYPSQLSCDYSFNCIPAVESMSDSRMTTIFSFLLGFIGLALYAAYNGIFKKNFSLANSLCWLIIPLLPSTHIFINIGTTIAERLLYIPSIGYCLLVGWSIEFLIQIWEKISTHKPSESAKNNKGKQNEKVKEKEKGKKGKEKSSSLLSIRSIILACLIVVVSLYFIRLRNRNEDWLTDENLFTSAMEVCPTSAKVQLNNGILSRRYERLDESIQRFERALQIDPNYCENNHQLGVTYINKGDLSKGLDYLREGLDCKYAAVECGTILSQVLSKIQESKQDKHFPKAYFYVGELLEKIGEEAKPKAILHYRESGNIYLQTAEKTIESVQKARTSYSRAYNLDSEKCQYESILGQLAFVMKDSEDALFHFQNAARCKIPSDPYLQSYLLLAKDALQKGPQIPKRHNDWAEASAFSGNKEQAVKYYISAAELWKQEGNVYDATEALLNALRLDPDSCESMNVLYEISLENVVPPQLEAVISSFKNHEKCGKLF